MPTGREMDIEDLHHTIATLGRSLGGETLETTRALYSPLHPEAPPQRVIRDLAYGAHSRQVLDVHLPVTSFDTALPVLIFVHGGGFTGGDKGGPGRALHDNIGRFAVEHGLIGVTMNYRLAPQHVFPAGSEDVAAAIEFIFRTVSEYGGDPTRIVAMGHSAGAALVASCVADPALRQQANGLCAAVLSSGIYEPQTHWDQVNTAYYGDDEAAWPGMASLPGLCATSLPLMFVVAEYDPPDFQRQAAIALRGYVEVHHRLPGFVVGRGHNHFSSPAHYGTADDELSNQVARFIAEVTS